jgi:hypothetical protein
MAFSTRKQQALGRQGIAGRDARRSWQSSALPPIDSQSKKARDGFFDA